MVDRCYQRCSGESNWFKQSQLISDVDQGPSSSEVVNALDQQAMQQRNTILSLKMATLENLLTAETISK